MIKDPVTPSQQARHHKLLSKKSWSSWKDSTMKKELQEAGSQGYALQWFTVGKTGARGSETIAIVK